MGSLELADPPKGALYLPSSDPKEARKYALQSPRTDQVPKMRKIGIRRRGQEGRGAFLPQRMLQMQYVQQGSGLHKPELPRARALLQGLPRAEVRT